jgi:tetratricopeptide (TPR) repeat protein
MALEEISAEFANVRAAWQWAVERGEAAQIVRAADGLWLVYAERSWTWEGAIAFADAVAFEDAARAAGVDDDLVALAVGKMLARHASAGQRLGRYDSAIEALEQSVALFRRLGDRRELGFALNLLAGTVHVLGQYREEHRLLEESIACSRVAGDQWTMAYSLNDLSLVEHHFGNDAAAQQLARESLAIFRQLGDRRGLAFALNNLGEIATHLGAYAEAAHLHEESLATRRTTDDLWGIACSLRQLGILARLTGDARTANARLREALRTAANAGFLPMVLEVLVELATLRVGEEKPEAARDILDAILAHPAGSGTMRDNAERLRAELPPIQPRQWKLATPLADIVSALVQGDESDGCLLRTEMR